MNHQQAGQLTERDCLTRSIKVIRKRNHFSSANKAPNVDRATAIFVIGGCCLLSRKETSIMVHILSGTFPIRPYHPTQFFGTIKAIVGA